MKLLTGITAVRRVARFPRHRVTQREAAMICSCAGLVAGRRYARTDLLAGLLIPPATTPPRHLPVRTRSVGHGSSGR